MEIRRRSRHVKALIIVATVVVILLIVYFAFSALLRPGLHKYAEMRVQAIATDAIYYAIYEAMAASEESYVDVLEQNGSVQYIEMNNRALNSLASIIAADTQTYLNTIGAQGIDIPMGTASGIALLAGWGPNMHLTFRPEGTAQVDFTSEFRSAGINQTLHRVHMVVRTDIAMVLPGDSRIVSTRVDMTVAEHVIVGDVPQGYAAGGGGILNLTP